MLRPGGTLLAGFLNPDLYIFDVAALDERGEFVVRHRIPYSTLDLSEEERSAGFGPDGPIEYSHTTDRADRWPARRGLRTDRIRGSSAPRRRDRGVHARLLRHPGREAATVTHRDGLVSVGCGSAGTISSDAVWISSVPSYPVQAAVTLTSPGRASAGTVVSARNAPSGPADSPADAPWQSTVALSRPPPAPYAIRHAGLQHPMLTAVSGQIAPKRASWVTNWPACSTR